MSLKLKLTPQFWLDYELELVKGASGRLDKSIENIKNYNNTLLILFTASSTTLTIFPVNDEQNFANPLFLTFFATTYAFVLISRWQTQLATRSITVRFEPNNISRIKQAYSKVINYKTTHLNLALVLSCIATVTAVVAVVIGLSLNGGRTIEKNIAKHKKELAKIEAEKAKSEAETAKIVAETEKSYHLYTSFDKEDNTIFLSGLNKPKAKTRVSFRFFSKKDTSALYETILLSTPKGFLGYSIPKEQILGDSCIIEWEWEAANETRLYRRVLDCKIDNKKQDSTTSSDTTIAQQKLDP